MSVANILSIVTPKLGLDPVTDRDKLLRYLNEAAYEIYIQADFPGTLEESVLQIAGDRTLALPSFMGELRAVRETDTKQPWHINQTRNLYNPLNWSQAWRTFRIKGRSPLRSSIVNYSTLTVSIAEVEDSPLVITITGATEYAQKTTDIITIPVGELVAVGVKQFIRIDSITKSVLTRTDVTISDTEGNILSTISNDYDKADYLIIDVSELPLETNPSAPRNNIVEVLYKKRLNILSQDTDEFPAQGCDTIIANKMLQIYYQQAGDIKKAEAYDNLTNRSLARKVDDVNKATEDIVGFYPNPQDSIQGRILGGRNYGYYWRNNNI